MMSLIIILCKRVVDLAAVAKMACCSMLNVVEAIA